jgi:hypothetical protein
MIMKHVAEGLKHKQMANESGSATITVEDSPWQHDDKGRGRSLPDLVPWT